MRKLVVGTVLFLSFSTAAGACTVQDVQNKAATLAGILQQKIHTRDDQREIIKKWNERASVAYKEMLEKVTTKDISAACRIYDQMIAEAKRDMP